MNTILIIEPIVADLEALMDFCRQGAEDITIVSARHFRQGQSILQNGVVDLILCSSTFTETEPFQVIGDLGRSYPYIPLIGIADATGNDRQALAATGASHCFTRPIRNRELLEEIVALAEAAHLGSVQGVPLHSLLQMHENDAQTCTLQVFSGNVHGFIFLENGIVINAETGELKGEEAFFEMIRWDHVMIDIRHFNGQREHAITAPLISLIMEGFRRKDEREHNLQISPSENRPRPRLHQTPTTGLRLALNIGQSLTIDLAGIDSALESMLVGMIADQCLIIATPSHLIMSRTALEPETQVIVKFTQMAQRYLFRTRVLREIDTPQPMLFLEYPTIVHFHDIRISTRANASFDCTLITQDGSGFQATCRDISSSGALFCVDRKENDRLPDVDLQQTITINCSLPEQDEDIRLEGIVKNIRKGAQLIQIGSEFSKPYPLLERSINRYLQTARFRQHGSGSETD